MIKLVRVYWNRHKNQWSVIDHKAGRVLKHLSHLALCSCTFHVSEAGRQRAMREKRRNVHAWVHGYLCDDVEHDNLRGDRVRYSPYDAGYFTVNDTDRPIFCTGWAWFDPLGQVWV